MNFRKLNEAPVLVSNIRRPLTYGGTFGHIVACETSLSTDSRSKAKTKVPKGQGAGGIRAADAPLGTLLLDEFAVNDKSSDNETTACPSESLQHGIPGPWQNSKSPLF
jgi:hypothetical protein